MMSKILAVLNRVETAPSVLVVAEQLADRLDGCRLEVLHPRLSQVPDFMPTEEVMTEERMRNFNVTSSLRAADLREIYDRWLSNRASDVPSDWREIIGEPRTSVASDGSTARLVVLGHVLPDDPPDVRAALDAALYDAQAAVVMAPPEPPQSVGRHMAVGWLESSAMERALDVARQLLRSGDTDHVTILFARTGRVSNLRVTPRPLQDLLDDVGVSYSVDEFDVTDQHVGDALCEHASQVGADLLVIGAHTHNRMVSWLRGSTTNEMLRHAAITLLMHR